MKAEETPEGAAKLLQAETYHAMRYIEALGRRKGQKARYGGEERISAATIRHRIAVLKTIYDVVRRDGLISRNPFDTPAFDALLRDKTQKRPTEMLDFKHVRRLCESPDSGSKEGVRDRAILALLFGGALRRGEAQNLRISDVKISRSGVSVLLRGTKAGTDALQALPPWAGAAVRALYEQRVKESEGVSEHLLTEYFSLLQTSSGRRLGDKQIYRIFCAWRDHCGLPATITPHSARATAITRLLELGISHREVAQFSRHASVATVERYDKLREGCGAGVAKRLEY